MPFLFVGLWCSSSNSVILHHIFSKKKSTNLYKKIKNIIKETMAFSSFPAYLDHPNLHQFQQPDHQLGSGVVENNHLPPPPPFAVGDGGGGGGGSSIRPGSMVDRARLAKLPLPEAGLKCPRCDSTNTKFCYFNNYSLTQPRHFCKTCRRYWTRGGALRNVPVGGGCRRNKKTKSNSSKSSITTAERPQIMASNSTNTASTSNHFPQHTNHQLPLMAGLQNLNHYGGGFQAQMMANTSGNGLSNMGFNLGGGNSNNDLSAQWKLPSSLGGFEPPTSLFPPFQGEGVDASSSLLGDQEIGSLAKSSAEVSHGASLKNEENPPGLNLTKQFLVSSDNNQFWSGSPWTGFSGLNSSSTSHLL